MTRSFPITQATAQKYGDRSRVQLKRRRIQKKREIVKIHPYFISLLLIKKVYKRKMVIYRNTTDKKVKFQEVSI